MLEDTLAHIPQLGGILPVCSHCKRIRMEGVDSCRRTITISPQLFSAFGKVTLRLG